MDAVKHHVYFYCWANTERLTSYQAVRVSRYRPAEAPRRETECRVSKLRHVNNKNNKNNHSKNEFISAAKEAIMVVYCTHAVCYETRRPISIQTASSHAGNAFPACSFLPSGAWPFSISDSEAPWWRLFYAEIFTLWFLSVVPPHYVLTAVAAAIQHLKLQTLCLR